MSKYVRKNVMLQSCGIVHIRIQKLKHTFEIAFWSVHTHIYTCHSLYSETYLLTGGLGNFYGDYGVLWFVVLKKSKIAHTLGHTIAHTFGHTYVHIIQV